MTGFSAEWLSLREPADRDARPLRLVEWIASAVLTPTPRVLDLATGTGSNLRYLAPHLGGKQHWVLADHDAALLNAIPARIDVWARDRSVALREDSTGLHLKGPGFDCRIECQSVDLAARLDTIDFRRFELVTTAALLDLVSGAWLEALVRRCVNAHCAVLFALSYDGRMRFSPDESGDARIRDLVNQHQRSDKGFGMALGPDAPGRTVSLLQMLGYEVLAEHSDWHIGDTQPHLQAELIQGWAAAAAAIAPGESVAIGGWRERRLAHVHAGRSYLVVGHQDVAAKPLPGVTIGPGAPGKP